MANYTLELGFDQNATSCLVANLFVIPATGSPAPAATTALKAGDTLSFLICDYTDYNPTDYPPGATVPTKPPLPEVSYVSLQTTDVLPSENLEPFLRVTAANDYNLTVQSLLSWSIALPGIYQGTYLIPPVMTSSIATAFTLANPGRFRIQFTVGLWNEQTICHDPEIIVGPGT